MLPLPPRRNSISVIAFADEPAKAATLQDSSRRDAAFFVKSFILKSVPVTFGSSKREPRPVVPLRTAFPSPPYPIDRSWTSPPRIAAPQLCVTKATARLAHQF